MESRLWKRFEIVRLDRQVIQKFLLSLNHLKRIPLI
jgi:hypothetical protein